MSSPVNVGDVIAGKYQVERVLGVGGMGVVVAAKHKTLGERYAIKFLLPQAMARADVVKRFRQEAQAAARLRSEHVARVYDDGELPGGEPYLVMEYLDGRDLGAVLRDEGLMPIERAVEYVLQACDALAEAHTAGIVHRDLKPSNLFRIKRNDGSPAIKLIDFGISKVQMPGAAGAEGEMTATAVMMGSPLYMAPEQMASARDVDARADIWSLGIILHALLTGGPPFRAPTVMGVYELIVQGPPSVRKQRPEVPEALEAAIHKCLQKDLTKRFADVGELAAALAPFGPAGCDAEVSRIKRILVARSSSGSIPPATATPTPAVAVTPATPEPSVERSAVGDKSAPGDKMLAESRPTGSSEIQGSMTGSSQGTGSSIVPDPQGTNGPWDQRTHPPTPRRPRIALVVSILALVAGVPIGFLLLRPSEPAKPLAGADSAPSVSAAASTEPSGAPSVSPAGTAKPDAEPSVSSSSSSSVAPTVSASAAPSAPPPSGPPPKAHPPRTQKPQPPARPPPPQKPPSTNLFDTQK
jgi:eukaryotic-like serine/threonine-protein kinase